MSKRAAVFALVGAITLVACGPDHGDAQDVRTLTSSRSYNGEERLRVDVTHAAGRLRLEPGAAGSLYRAQLSYDERFFTPISEYTNGRLRIGVEGERVRIARRGGGEPANLTLALGPEAALDLNVQFGAAEARMELGGLRLRDLSISTGASDTQLSFSRPNPERMADMKIDVGAAAFRVEGLGNANVQTLRVNGGVGDVQLSFDGEWRGNMDAHLSMGVGALRLVLPRGVGVEVRRSGFLSAFDGQELERRGDHYYSRDWDTATHRLTIRIDAAFGKTDVRWTGGEM
jgi:hypothetical protein